MMRHNAIIVGGGAAGLTAAAFLAKSGRNPLLLEKQAKCGGLINSFTRDGFTFDGGIRALENAGVMFPMLKKLGIEMEFLENRVSIGIEDQVIKVDSSQNLSAYETLLKSLYPKSAEEIAAIVADIQQITHYMEIQYGIDNPLFLDMREDRDYFIKEVFPWMFKYALTVPKVARKNQPVSVYLKQFTKNQALIDIIAQHFFTDTPAFFALSYFRLYEDYYYPKNGTGMFTQKLSDFICQNGGQIETNTAVTAIDLTAQTISTSNGETLSYQTLLWAADQKTLYEIIDTDALQDHKVLDAVHQRRDLLKNLSGNDSIFTLYLQSNLDKNFFESISSPHFFYTPTRQGQSRAGKPPLKGEWDAVQHWLEDYFALTTYEISIPVLRNPTLAPEGKTGLIVSTLFDYTFAKSIQDRGWDERFRDFVAERMITTLDTSVYPGLTASVEAQFTATPLTLEKRTGNTEGAITGWSFANPSMPAENRLVRISNSVRTPLPNVVQAGQWTYSPSGFPVSLITGKLAADRIGKLLR